MKIIGQAGRDSYLVQMSTDEIVKAAGYSSPYNDAWEKANGRREPIVGTEIGVNAAYSYHERVQSHQEAAAKSARTLRALADMIDGALPEVVIPLVDPDFAQVPLKGGDA
ncbi:hypothetical protein EHS39_32940 [Ensifer sp. MPMI2T]|nr:hypothetical protein EHS39_32940 [Ensifer sp. MPMI2T]